ncbi:hypothetical protein [Kitasatospora sp. NRRL B-11411]|nr:hypothetical protein [Kitasatospora sp. NRRL B-11411]
MTGSQGSGTAVFGVAGAIVALLGVEVPIRQLDCGCHALQVDVTHADRRAEGKAVQLLMSTPGAMTVGRIRRGYRLLGAAIHAGGCPVGDVPVLFFKDPR